MAEGSWIRIGAVDARLDADTINPIIKAELGKRAISITQKPELRQKIGEELLRVVTPFVPVSKEQKPEHLCMTGRATEDGRLYWSAVNDRGYNYAAAVYDKDGDRWPGGKYSHSESTKTYPQWVTHVTNDSQQWNAFVNAIIPLIVKEFAEDE